MHGTQNIQGTESAILVILSRELCVVDNELKKIVYHVTLWRVLVTFVALATQVHFLCIVVNYM